jgi:competence ComEA-like helix-hairpin-helix protein
MSLRARLESALGLTRGDVTLALFIAATALFGFVYLTFFDDRLPDGERLELLRLQSRYDSIVAAREREPRAAFERDARRDTLPTLESVLAENATEARETASRERSKPRGGGGAPSSPVDLNTASKEELVELPGVGEKTADAIIERRKHIPFNRPEDLMEVKGIGEKKFAKIKPYVRVR